MTMNRRDFFKVLGAAVALPAMNLKGLLKDEKEMEFHIYTSRPEPVMAELLGQLGKGEVALRYVAYQPRVVFAVVELVQAGSQLQVSWSSEDRSHFFLAFTGAFLATGFLFPLIFFAGGLGFLTGAGFFLGGV